MNGALRCMSAASPSAAPCDPTSVGAVLNATIITGVEDVVDSAREGWRLGLTTGMEGARRSTLRFINVEAPTGRLGIELSNAMGALGGSAGGVRVAALDAASPLQLLVHVGWHLVAVNGQKVPKGPVEVADRLRAGADRPRLLRFATERDEVVFIRQKIVPSVMLVVMLAVVHAIMNRYNLS